MEKTLPGRREHARGGEGLRRQRPRRVQARRYRHQPARHQRSPGGAGLCRRREDRDAERRADRRGVPGDRREVHRGEIRVRRCGAPQQRNQNKSGLEKSSPMSTIQAVRGMNDILPGEAEAWLGFEAKVEAWLERYGYRNIRMPLVEHTQLFRRAIGEATDIVEKEMYSWRDELNKEELTLPPEGTASCVRAAIEHSLLHDGPKRLWYSGPMFRHERPQKGRYRQFHQYGVEALGYPGPDVDAELIIMCAALWRELGLEGIRLELNTIGSPEERSRYRTDLVSFLEKNSGKLDDDARPRMHSNPLRTLDSKNPMVKEVVAHAPSMTEFLGEASRAHFDGLKNLLDSQQIAFQLNSKLVRGLDYYNLTLFEWVSDRLGAQRTVCGGGRYDRLFAPLGGKPAPAPRFPLGTE